MQCVHSPLPLLNSKNLLSQNETDHIENNRLHYLSKMQWRETWKTINIQQNIFLGPNEYQLILIKIGITGKLFVKLKVREVQRVLCIS
jgi:hypothetical protein